jgi:hypothetical protein
MIGSDDIRAIALGLPGVEEGRPVPAARRIAAFKVGGKSFAGLERGGRTLTISLDETEARAIVADIPGTYEDIRRKDGAFMGLRVDLSTASLEDVRKMIEASWRHRGHAS